MRPCARVNLAASPDKSLLCSVCPCGRFGLKAASAGPQRPWSPPRSTVTCSGVMTLDDIMKKSERNLAESVCHSPFTRQNVCRLMKIRKCPKRGGGGYGRFSAQSMTYGFQQLLKCSAHSPPWFCSLSARSCVLTTSWWVLCKTMRASSLN